MSLTSKTNMTEFTKIHSRKSIINCKSHLKNVIRVKSFGSHFPALSVGEVVRHQSSQNQGINLHYRLTFAGYDQLALSFGPIRN